MRTRKVLAISAGKLTFACDSPIASDHRKMSALTEEVGEVAKECLDSEVRDKKAQARIRLRTELTQVAAVAIAWLEALEQEHSK